MNSSDQITTIRQGQQRREYWKRFWAYRELLYFLARRDFVVKYRQTMAGIIWLLMRPLQQVFIFTVIFGVIANLPSGEVSYPVLVMSGVVIWQFFSAIVTQSSNCLVNNTNLITKVFFPRILLPVGTVAPNLIDLAINLIALAVIMAFYGDFPIWRIAFLPIPIMLAGFIALGFGMWFSAAAARYRDFRQLSTFLLQGFHLLSPLGYSSDILSERLGIWTFLYYCNPLVGVIDLTRWCVLPAGAADLPHMGMLAISLGFGLLLIYSGQKYFRHCERTFADVI